MTQKKSAEPSRRGLAWGVASLVFFVLAVALIWCLVTMPAATEGVSAVIRGLGGSLSFFLPVLAVYLGILTGKKALGKGGSVIRGALDVLVILAVYAMVHVFYAEQILRGMTLSTYANFVKFSYNLQLGGGAFGALLAFPAHSYLGAALGFVALLVASLVLLAVNGRLNFFFNWLRERGDAGDYYEESPARPMPAGRRRKNERMFDADGNSLLEDVSEVPGYLSRAPRQPKKPAQKKVSERDRERQLYKESVPAAGRRSARRPAPAPAQEPAEETPPVRKPAKPDAPIGADAFLKADPVEGKPKQEKATAPKEAKETEKKNNTPFAGKTPAPAHEEPEEDIDEIFRVEPEVYEKEEAPAPLPSFSKSKKITAKKPAPVPAPDEEEEPEYDSFPPIDLLATGETKEVKINRGADIEKAHLLESTLKSFGIDAKLTGIAHGPAVTRFELAPAPGIKVSRITSLADDIALNLAARTVRIEAPIPGKAAVGVEIPNDVIETVNLRDVLESTEARNHASRIAVGLGKDNSGRYIVADIAKMPHVLIAGQTGSGKSVCINSIIVSILYRATPKEVQLILIDPKVVELSIYNNIPHLITPVVTDPKKAASALDWAVAEMSRRYKKFADREVRDIKGYNKKLQPGEDPMPQIVIIIDELADLMMVVPGEVEDSICRLAQLARACGMHLVIATQRPSVNVITGIIKANIPSRIAFSVASQVDSRTMIDHGGAEKLLGNGDMLYVPSGINKPMRVQGSWVSDDEVHRVVEYVRTRSEPNYDPDLLEHMNKANLSDAEKDDVDDEFDPRLAEAVEIVVEAGQASTSMLQRRMRVGYARAGRLIDEMEIRGIVGEANGAKPRDVLISREEYLQMFKEDETDEYED